MEGGYCTEISFFYRDILETLNKIQHVVKATEFIGQTSDGKIWKEGIYLGIGLHSLAAEDCMKENLQENPQKAKLRKCNKLSSRNSVLVATTQ
jgi:hypothetical protein